MPLVYMHYMKQSRSFQVHKWQMEVESTGYSQISQNLANVSKPAILEITNYDEKLYLIQEAMICTSYVSSGLELGKMGNDIKRVGVNVSESNPESDPSGISGAKLINQYVDDLSQPSAQAKSTNVDDAHDTEEEKDDEKPGDSGTFTDDTSGSASSYSKADLSG